MKMGKKKKEEPKKAALDRALEQIEKQFGKGAIMRLGEGTTVEAEVISTGALTLDWALTVGGVPRGRVVEIFGPEGSGKTTLALHIVANVQKAKGVAAFIDAEHAVDVSYAERIGVDLDSLYVSQPDTGEQALEIADVLIRSSAMDLIIVDSVAALVPRAELEGDMGQAHMGLQARLMSQALRKLAGAIRKSRTCLIFTNQIRMKIGVFFGNPETTPGGRALKFYSSVRIDLRRIGSVKDGDTVTGSVVRARVVKNKIGPPFRKAEFDITFTTGISWEGTVLDMGVTHGIVNKSGSWFSWNETRLGQGREQSGKFLREHPDVCGSIESSVREKLGLTKG